MKDKNRTIITEPFVQKSIIKYLASLHWQRSLIKAELNQSGVDIKIRNNQYGRDWLIEVKGDPSERVKSPSGSRSSSFNSALGQIITRMHTNRKRAYKYGNKYGIGLPVSFKKMVLKKLPYDTCDKLNLYVFFVNHRGDVEEFDHKKLKILQNQQ